MGMVKEIDEYVLLQDLKSWGQGREEKSARISTISMFWIQKNGRTGDEDQIWNDVSCLNFLFV